jgi:hypothetical protein
LFGQEPPGGYGRRDPDSGLALTKPRLACDRGVLAAGDASLPNPIDRLRLDIGSTACDQAVGAPRLLGLLRGRTVAALLTIDVPAPKSIVLDFRVTTLREGLFEGGL